MHRRTWLAAAGAAALGGILPRAYAANDYPNRPIRLIVPFLAGTSPDNMARALSAELAPKLGQPLVVENMPGAGGIIGGRALKRAAADGYTLGVLANTHVINIHMYKQMPYDPARDFTCIAPLSGGPTALVLSLIHI